MDSSIYFSLLKNIVGKYLLDLFRKAFIFYRLVKKCLFFVGVLLIFKFFDVFIIFFVGEEKIGVLLLNFGGLEILEDV